MINFFITNKSTYPHRYVLLLVPVTLVHFFLVFHFVCCGVSAWEKIIFSLAKNSPPDCFFTLAFKSGHRLACKIETGNTSKSIPCFYGAVDLEIWLKQ